MIWYNRKENKEEDLTQADLSQLSEKLSITIRRIEDHKVKLEKLRKIKREIIKLMEQKGVVVKEGEQVPPVFIYNTAICDTETIDKKGLDINELVKQGKIISYLQNI